MSRTGAAGDEQQPLFIPGAPPPFLYTLEQAAVLTGWSVRSLLDECRAGRIRHVNRKGTYGLTAAQIHEAIDAYTREPAAVVDETERARAELSAHMNRPHSRAKRVAA